MHKTTYILIVLLLLVGFGTLVYLMQPAGEQNGATSVDSSEWPEYVNEEYNFAVKHPPEWSISARPDDQIAPKFNIYKPASTEKAPPFDHFAEATHVSVFPEGIPTEGEFGTREEMQSPPLQEQTRRAEQFVFEDGNPWAIYAQFTQAPASWNGSGFVWAKAVRQNLEVECTRDGEPLSQEECDPLFGDDVSHSGSVNENDWNTIQAMLQTFRFLEHGSGDVSDNIQLFSPDSGAEIESPLVVEGQARGMWYFEATFPIVLTDWDGRIIAEWYAEAQSNWMSEDFVPFRGEITFEAPEGENRRGTLILQRANASGLPEHDAAIEIPVMFAQ